MTETPPRILINGLGRSGTSWLMKIFDHHPMVLAAHEPERTLAPPVPQAPAAETRAYTEALFAARPLRAMRKRPILRKPYRSTPAHALRLALIYGASALARIRPGLRGWQVPDLAAGQGVARVVKSVSHQQALPAIAAHDPSVRIVYLVRHPCGNVFSGLTGQALAKYHDLYLPNRDLMAALYGEAPGIRDLTEADCSQLEILAYRWAVDNHHIVAALEGCATARVLRYEDLCADPVGEAKALFAWAGLGWHPDCEAFLARSLAADGDAAGYHDLIRNPAVAAGKWREQMPEAEIAAVEAICRPSRAWGLYA